MKITKGHSLPTYILLAVYFCLILLPVILMVSYVHFETIVKTINGAQFKTAFLNSLAVTSFVCVVVIPLALIFALLEVRYTFPCKSLFALLFVTPMLIPSISHGMGLISLLGNNGFLTQTLGVNIGLYGFNGIALGATIYSFPVAYLMFSDAVKYMDNSIYESADILGVSPLGAFLYITLPYIRRTIISATFAVFTMVFTDYGVPLAIGGRYSTLPVLLYKEVIGMLDFSKGAFIGLILITPAFVAFVLDTMKRESGMSFSRKSITAKRSRFTFVFFSIFALIAVFMCLPILSFIILAIIEKSSANWGFLIESDFLYTLKNSILIAIFTSVFGTIVSFVTAYVTARTVKSIAKRLLHLVSISSIAIPGIVLGLGYVIAFKGTLFYGTLFILITVNIVHFLATPYLMAYNALHKLNPHLESVGDTIGVSRLHLFIHVVIPSAKNTIFEMCSYFFVNSIITISAVAFLFTVRTKPVSMLIPQFESNLSFEAIAIVSLSILLTNIVYKFLSMILQKVMCRA